MQGSTEPRRQGTSQIAGHLTCITCDYDLHGLPLRAKCHECGDAVLDSLKQHRRRARGSLPLSECNAQWLRRLVEGITMIPIGAGFAVVAGWVGLVWRAE